MHSLLPEAAKSKFEKNIYSSLETGSACELNDHMFYDLFAGRESLKEAKNFAQKDQLDRAAESLLEYFRDRTDPVFFIHNSEIKILHEYLRNYDEICQSIKNSADNAMAHKFTPFGSAKTYWLPLNIDWSSDFESGNYPDLHVKELEKLLNSDKADTEFLNHPSLKYTRELNEHSHFLDLAESFWISGEDNYASEFLIQASHWAKVNKIWKGVNWLNSESTAVRATNWMLALNMCLSCRFLLPKTFVIILFSLITQAASIAVNLQIKEEPSLAEVSALYMFCCCFPEIILTTEWKRIAADKFPDAIAKYFPNKGLHFSNSLTEHCRALEWLLLPINWHVSNKSEAPEFLKESCGNALNALHFIMGPSRLSPNFGITTKHGFLGHNVNLEEYAKNLLCLGAILLNNGKWCVNYDTMPCELLWWIGIDADIQFKQLERELPTNFENYFVSNGIGIMRDGWSKESSQCIIIGNTSADRKLAPILPDFKIQRQQDHSDIFSVILNIQNEPILIDPGSTEFKDSKDKYLSSLLAHSVPVILEEITPFTAEYYENLSPSQQQLIDQPQLQTLKEKLCEVNAGRKSICSPLYTSKSEYGTVYTAIRQAKLKNGFTACISRDVLFIAQSRMMVIRDTFSGPKEAGELHLQSSLLFGPNLNLIMKADMGCIVKKGNISMAEVIPIFPKGTRHIYNKDDKGKSKNDKGKSNPYPTGWYCKNKNFAQTKQIRYCSTITLPQKSYFIIDWTRKQTRRWLSKDLDALLDG